MKPHRHGEYRDFPPSGGSVGRPWAMVPPLCPRIFFLLVMVWLTGPWMTGGLLPDAIAQAAPITITNITPLDFGYCDAVPSATYTVLPAASPGAGACQGASAARFDITGDPNRQARVTLPNFVNITNGTETFKVNLTDSAGGPGFCLGAGAYTLYVGGTSTIPAGGLTTTGLFSITDSLALAYFGGPC